MIIQYRTRLTDLLSRRPTGRRVFYWQQTPRSSLRFFLAHNFLTNSYPNSSHPFSFRLPHSFAPRLLACPPVPTALCCLPTRSHRALLLAHAAPSFPPRHCSHSLILFLPSEISASSPRPALCTLSAFSHAFVLPFFCGQKGRLRRAAFLRGVLFLSPNFFRSASRPVDWSMRPFRVYSIGQCARFAST